MALEFALRPRFDLERPSRQPRLRRSRVSRLALPIAFYWLAMAGATHGLIQLLAEDSGERLAGAATTPDALAAEDAPAGEAPPPPELSGPETAQNAALTPPPEREPEAEPEAEPESEPEAEPEPHPLPMAAPAEGEPEPARSIVPTTPAPVARRPLVARAEPAPLPIRNEPRAPERPAPPTLFDEPLPRSSEPRQARAKPDAPSDPTPGPALPSCESAAASANQTVDLRAARGAPDLTRESLASVLENGAYLASCAIPARTTLEICAAVQDGKVVGVSAVTEPRSAAINACVRRAVASLRFPKSARLDITRTRFQAGR